MAFFAFGLTALLVLQCALATAAAPQEKPSNEAQFVFDILPDAGDLVTRLGTDCDVGAAAQAQSSSSSFSMVLPGNIIVAASFSEARAAAGSGVIGTPSPFHGRGVTVTAPNGVTYNIRAPVEAEFKVQGPEGTKSVVQRSLPPPASPAISFPKQ